MIAGDEDEVADGLRRYAALGTTDALVSPVGNEKERRRTLEVIGSL